MFSPIGSKKIMYATHNKARTSGLSITEAAKRNQMTFENIRIKEENEKAKSQELPNFDGDKDISHKYWTETEIADLLLRNDVSGVAARKLANSAIRYRKDRDGFMFKSFESVFIDYLSFRNILKRVFALEFTNQEFVEICKFIDGNGNRTHIECSKFQHFYITIGRVCKDEKKRKDIQRNESIQQSIIQAEEKEKLKLNAKFQEGVDYNFDINHFNSAMIKIKEGAEKYDRSHPSAMSLNGFDAEFIQPSIFRNLLKLTFNIDLTPKELGAIVRHYDTDNKGTVNSTEFITYFLKLGFDLRMIKRSKQLQHLQKLSNEYKNNSMKLLENCQISIIPDYNFNEIDHKNAIQKIRSASINYNRYGVGCNGSGLQCFEMMLLKPNEFYDALKRSFNIILTKKELGALMRIFDPNGVGYIVSADFVNQFLKLGFAERSRINSSKL